MKESIAIKYLKIGDYFQFSSNHCIKISNEEVCDKHGILEFDENILVLADPNHRVQGGRNK